MKPETCAVTFSDWRRAAVRGYVDGGMRIEAAKGIVEGAANDIHALTRGGLTPDLYRTFLVTLDAHAAKWRWRYGATIFQ